MHFSPLTSISVQVRVLALNESMQPITERVVIDIRVCTVFMCINIKPPTMPLVFCVPKYCDMFDE